MATSVVTAYAPDLEKFTKSLRNQPLEASIASLISLLKRRQIQGPEPCALATANVLLQVVAKSTWTDEDDLLAQVALVGQRLLEAQPNELVIGNIVRRILSLIRDEATEDRNEGGDDAVDDDQDPEALILHSAPRPPRGSFRATPLAASLARQTLSSASPSPHRAAPVSGISTPRSTDTDRLQTMRQLSFSATISRHSAMPSFTPFSVPKSLFSLLSTSPDVEPQSTAVPPPLRRSGTWTPTSHSMMRALRSEVINGIEEIKDEIEQVADQIASADTQIRPCDYVLIHNPTSTVKRYLLRAASRRKFTVLVSCPPLRPGQTATDHNQYASFRKDLTKAGVSVIHLFNTGIMAYVPQVSRVVLEARAVLANGNVILNAGAGALARAAKDLGRPVVILSGVYQLSPECPVDTDRLVEWADPATAVNFASGAMVGAIEVRVALTEVLPAEFVDIYITNLGMHCRNHLPSIISEHYKREDMDFCRWSEIVHEE